MCAGCERETRVKPVLPALVPRETRVKLVPPALAARETRVKLTRNGNRARSGDNPARTDATLPRRNRVQQQPHPATPWHLPQTLPLPRSWV